MRFLNESLLSGTTRVATYRDTLMCWSSKVGLLLCTCFVLILLDLTDGEASAKS
jgi:hypothetical protein